MKLFRRIDYWLHRRAREAELAEELEFHRAKAGVPEFGNVTIAREDARAVWIWPWLESVFQDLCYALRNLRRQPAFALIALLTLGLAIGLNTSLFTVFDAVAWRQLPVKDPARVVKLIAQPIGPGRVHGFSLAEYQYFRDHSKTLAGVIALNDERVHLGFESFGKGSGALFVSANYFELLGIPMERGRGFFPEEDRLDQPEAVAVLSYATWRDHYDADASIVGKQIRVDEVPFIVVGVAGETFLGTSGGREDVWMPLAALQLVRQGADTREFLRSPNHCCTPLAARLAPGVTRPAAEAELGVLSRQFHQENKLDPATVLTTDSTILAGHPKRRSFMPIFALMFASVLTVLLLACANVSNLLLARSAARQHEIDVRRAIGAGRARIVRQLLTEGLVIALGAAAIGVALGWKLPDYLFSQMGDGPSVRLTPDFKVILYAAALAGLACLAFALAPALHVSKSGARAKARLRNLLLIAQVAMSVVLLIGAGLMVAGVRHARTQDPAFRIDGVSMIAFELPASAYDAKRTREFSEALAHELAANPEFKDMGIADLEPLANQHSHTGFRLPSEPPETDHGIDILEVNAGYFRAIGVPIVEGRNFTAGDDARNAIIINQAAERRYFPNESAIGKVLVRGKISQEIVGVARDAYLTYLDGIGPLMFVPFTGRDTPRLLITSAITGAADTVGQAARRIEPRARIQTRPLAANLDIQLAESRTMAGIAGALGIFALALATVGMSGVFAYVVQQRTKEIGIRMALGADPKQVIRLVLAGTARAAIIGLTFGYLASIGVAKLLTEYLYGVSPYDLRAYGAVALVLSISGLAAAYFPARRATRIDPLIALRVE